MKKYSLISNEKHTRIPFLILFIASAPFVAGFFYEWLACAAGIVLAGYLMWYAWVHRELRIPRSPVLFAVAVVAGFYGLSAFWAVDRGMALVGFAKFLPLPLFVLAWAQIPVKQREWLFPLLPACGSVMVIVSLIVSRLPQIGKYFLVSGRQAGLFQYPNTYGLYLLLGVVVLLARRQVRADAFLELLILLCGIYLSGSRTTFFLLALLAAGCLFVREKTLMQKVWIILVAAGGLLLGGYLIATRNFSVIERYLHAFSSSSTFWERLLLYKDALPLIFRRPFGLGYTGYSTLQMSIQTAAYSARNVHNELLQLLLDVGWIPGVCMVAAVVRSFLKISGPYRVLLVIFLLHSMFDFDMQFLAMDFIFLAMMESREEPFWTVKEIWPVSVGSLAAGVVFLYFGIASACYYTGMNAACTALYPGYTSAWIELLKKADTEEQMDAIADRILSLNSSVTLAYSAKARVAYYEGDFAAVIAYKKKAIENARYSLAEYIDYFEMLRIGVQLYEQSGDSYSAEYCAQRLLEIPDLMQEVVEHTDPRAYGLPGGSRLELPQEYQGELEKIRERYG